MALYHFSEDPTIAELRVTPRLVELRHCVVGTTLDYSGTRLNNALDWREPPER